MRYNSKWILSIIIISFLLVVFGDPLIVSAKEKKDGAAVSEQRNALNWQTTVLVTGVALGLHHYDKPIQNWSQEHRNKTSDRVADVAQSFGEVKYTVPALAAIYYYGHAHKDEKMQTTALLGVNSVAAASVLTGAIKLAGHRERPDHSDARSFPSNHAASAFAMAAVVADQYGDKPGVSGTAYGLAALTALSRVNDNEHWASDVFFGSVLGYLAGKKACSNYHNKQGNNAIELKVDSDQTQVMLSHKI